MKTIEEPKEEIFTKLQLLKSVSEVQSKIKDTITSDFTLAVFNETQREGATEMVVDAYYAKTMMEILKEKTKNQWTWNKKQQLWEKTPRPNHEAIMNKITEHTFNIFMTRIYMMAILHRNTEQNTMLKILAQAQEEPETQEQDLTTKEKLKEMLIPSK